MSSLQSHPFVTEMTDSTDSKTFTIKAKAPTDIWRKPGPPEVSTFNAPMIVKKTRLSSFSRARITVSASWRTLYDQGGLIFVLPPRDPAAPLADGKWLKTGIEFYDGKVNVSTVSKDRWADWSLVRATGDEATLEIERSPEEGTLWVYAGEGADRIPLREVTWILSEEDQELWVGVYAAKPTKGEDEELVVHFKNWELELK